MAEDTGEEGSDVTDRSRRVSGTDVGQGDAATTLEALSDARSREIVALLADGEDGDAPALEAAEIAAALEIPQSTTYRKLDRLTDTDLVTEESAYEESGHHSSRYAADAGTVVVQFDEGDLTVTVDDTG